MNPTLNKAKDFVEVGGRLPLFYMQDGHGFDRAGNYLGEFDAQGEPRKKGAAKETFPEPESPVTEDDSYPWPAPEADVSSADSGDTAGDQAPPAQSPATADRYKGLKISTLRKRAEALGLDPDPGLSRDDLITLLLSAED
jgi:hypothetical protein